MLQKSAFTPLPRTVNILNDSLKSVTLDSLKSEWNILDFLLGTDLSVNSEGLNQ